MSNDLFKNKLKSVSVDFNGLTDIFVKNYLSPNTKLAYARDIRSFFEYCLNRNEYFESPDQINSTIFREYRDHMIHDLKFESSTVIRKLVAMRNLLNFCVQEGKIDRNPLLSVLLPRAKNISTTLAFTDEEVRRILTLPRRTTPSGRLHYAVLVALFYMGLRKAELIEIKNKDFVNEKDHFVLIIKGKGENFRKIPITPFVKRVLDEYKNGSDRILKEDSFLFQPVRNNYSKTTDRPLHRCTIDWIVKSYAKKAAVNKRVSPHSCRASLVSNLLENKIPVRDVANLVGHSSVQTTTLYDKRKDNLDKSAAYQVQY